MSALGIVMFLLHLLKCNSLHVYIVDAWLNATSDTCCTTFISGRYQLVTMFSWINKDDHRKREPEVYASVAEGLKKLYHQVR